MRSDTLKSEYPILVVMVGIVGILTIFGILARTAKPSEARRKYGKVTWNGRVDQLYQAIQKEKANAQAKCLGCNHWESECEC